MTQCSLKNVQWISKSRKYKIKTLCLKVYALPSQTFSTLDLDFFPNDQALPSTTVALRLWLILPVYMTLISIPFFSATNKTTLSSVLWKTCSAIITIPNYICFLISYCEMHTIKCRLLRYYFWDVYDPNSG